MDSFQEFICGDLSFAGAPFPQRIDQGKNLVEPGIPANGCRGGWVQWLHSVSKFFARGIRPHGDVFVCEENQFSQRRRRLGCGNPQGQASHEHWKNIAQSVNLEFVNRALSNSPFFEGKQTRLINMDRGYISKYFALIPFLLVRCYFKE